MKIFSKVLALMALVAVTVACEKKEKEETQPSAVSSCDYFSYKVGNEFIVRTQEGLDTTVVTGTTTIDGEQWLVFDTEGDLSYNRCDGQYWFVSTPDSGQTLTFRIMRTVPSVDDTWTDTENINGVESNYKRTVVSVGMTRTVEGTTYTDVAMLLIETSFIFQGVEYPGESYTEFYSVSAGYLESTLENSEQTLVSRTY